MFVGSVGFYEAGIVRNVDCFYQSLEVEPLEVSDSRTTVQVALVGSRTYLMNIRKI